MMGNSAKKEISADDDKKPWFLRYIFPVQSFDVWVVPRGTAEFLMDGVLSQAG